MRQILKILTDYDGVGCVGGGPQIVPIPYLRLFSRQIEYWSTIWYDPPADMIVDKNYFP